MTGVGKAGVNHDEDAVRNRISIHVADDAATHAEVNVKCHIVVGRSAILMETVRSVRKILKDGATCRTRPGNRILRSNIIRSAGIGSSLDIAQIDAVGISGQRQACSLKLLILLGNLGEDAMAGLRLIGILRGYGLRRR